MVMGQIWTFILKLACVVHFAQRFSRTLYYKSPRSQAVHRWNHYFQTFYGVLYGLTCYKSNTATSVLCAHFVNIVAMYKGRKRVSLLLFSLAREDLTQNTRQYFTLRFPPCFFFFYYNYFSKRKKKFTTSTTRNYDNIRYSIKLE